MAKDNQCLIHQVPNRMNISRKHPHQNSLKEDVVSKHHKDCIPSDIPTYLHTYIHAYTHTYIHACMHACMHTYIYIYICIYIGKMESNSLLIILLIWSF